MHMMSKRRVAALLVVLVVQFGRQASYGQALTFTTFAGQGGGSEDGAGSKARFDKPTGVAIDNLGNVYVTDAANCTVRKMSRAGAVTTLAGLAGTRGSADGRGSAARFNFLAEFPGLATDRSGNIYVADTVNQTIRKITPSGDVTTLAGLAGTRGSADGRGSAARFATPRGVAIDSGENLYVADSGNSTIRKITADGEVTTLAGLAGTRGSTDGAGSVARFAGPIGVATDSSGSVYVGDTGNSTIRKITPDGEVTTVAGLAGSSYILDGTGSAARFALPEGMATDVSGNVYVADVSMIRKITPAGVVTTLVSGFLPNYPSFVATDSSGNVYVADTYNETIVEITPSGSITTLAGVPAIPESKDGLGSTARFRLTVAVATDSSDNVYVADIVSVRKITPTGVVTTLVDSTGRAVDFSLPQGIAIDSSGNLYVSENGRIRKITPTGEVTTLAGAPNKSGNVDGTGTAARFNGPSGVATDGNGNVYVADMYNNTIRKITPAGVVTTLAGLAGTSGSADGTGNAARFYLPFGIAADGNGNIYVADRYNSMIRKVTPAGVVTTVATGFSLPNGVAIDASDNVYVADTGTNTIRKIAPSGDVTTLGGLAGVWGNEDGTGSAARFNGPFGVAIDRSGNVYVVDLLNSSVHIGKAAPPDVATIDLSSTTIGATRQLDISALTATTWQWSVIRRPVDAVADFPATTIRNPTFTPDAAGLFTFRLIANGAAGTSITTVDLTSTLPDPSPRRRAIRH